jgi:hypothetical protein
MNSLEIVEVFPFHVLVTVEFIVNPGLIPSDDATEVLHYNKIQSNKSRCPYESDYALVNCCTNLVEAKALTLLYALP